MRLSFRTSHRAKNPFAQPLEELPVEFRPKEKLVFLTPTLEVLFCEEYINFKHCGQRSLCVSGEQIPTGDTTQEPRERILVHCDLDAFFAAVEILHHSLDPARPLIIGSDPQAGRGRGIVSTCNYAARAFGIHSAMPISEAWRRCPGHPFGPGHYIRGSRGPPLRTQAASACTHRARACQALLPAPCGTRRGMPGQTARACRCLALCCERPALP